MCAVISLATRRKRLLRAIVRGTPDMSGHSTSERKQRNRGICHSSWFDMCLEEQVSSIDTIRPRARIPVKAAKGGASEINIVQRALNTGNGLRFLGKMDAGSKGAQLLRSWLCFGRASRFPFLSETIVRCQAAVPRLRCT